MRFKFLRKEEIGKIPQGPGVYCFKSKTEILYIGKAVNLIERIKNHFQNPTFKDYLFLDQVEKIGYIQTDSEIEALILEAKLIKEIQPRFNVLWKDSKNYFFVGKTKEDFPRIFISHQIKPFDKNFEIEYIGPFVDGKALKQTLKILRKIFPFRSCKKIPSRPCLWYHLNYCPAPCLLKSKLFEEIKKNSKIKKICQRNAKNVFEFLQKGKDFVFKKLKKEIKKASKNQEFEEAARIRDQILKLERVLAHSKILEEITTPKWNEIEEKLKKFLNLEKVFRIEAFDVSNIRGKLATGSMVTFLEGVPEKKLYRKFKIKFEKKPNDFEMLKEALKRRFEHKEWGLPELILIDGGKAHLNLAINCKSEKESTKKIKIIALAKKENKLFIEGEEKPIFLKDLPCEISNFLQKIRDEAHRFAISYHRLLREKSFFNK